MERVMRAMDSEIESFKAQITQANQQIE